MNFLIKYKKFNENNSNYSEKVKQLMYDLESEYNVDLFLYYTKFGKGIILSKIVVPKSLRNENIGKTVMEKICEFADKNTLPIYLTPSNSFGGSVKRLKKFYKNFNFEKYKGYKVKESLIRYPASN